MAVRSQPALALGPPGLGQFILPTVVGVIAGAAGISAIFWSMGLLLTASSAVVRRGFSAK
jgi:hypothetical protein